MICEVVIAMPPCIIMYRSVYTVHRLWSCVMQLIHDDSLQCVICGVFYMLFPCIVLLFCGYRWPLSAPPSKFRACGYAAGHYVMY